MTFGSLSSAAVTLLSERVRAVTGLHFPPTRHAHLGRAMDRAAADLETSPQSLLDSLASDIQHARSQPWQALIRHLAVGETYFFREMEVLDRMLHSVLIEEHEPGQPLRVWSAACSTGEEAYMASILLDRAGFAGSSRDARVIGTDINIRSLERAQAGVYGAWSFRSAPQWLQAGYFRGNADKTFSALQKVRRHISFSYLNLADCADAAWPADGSMDIVLCRNVLMYLAPVRSHAILERIARALTPDGYLVVGQCEASFVEATGLYVAEHPGSALFRPSSPSRFKADALRSMSATEETTLRLLAAAGAPTSPWFPGRSPRAAREMAGRGEDVRASTSFDATLDDGPDSASACCRQALMLTEAGLTDAARLAWQRALELDDSLVIAHIGMGTLGPTRGRDERAIRHLTRAAQLLRECRSDDIVPQFNGLTASQVSASLAAILAKKRAG